MDERFLAPLQLDLAKLKRDVEEIAGRWNGEDDVFDGVSEEKAHLCINISEKVYELNTLLDEYNQL